MHTFVHCKMHVTMCTLRANYVKEGGDLQNRRKYIIYICTLKIVHGCKINAPRTHTYPYGVSATKRSFLQPVVP